MKKINLTIGIIISVFLIAFLTNPGPEKHQEKLKVKLTDYLQKASEENMSESDDMMEKAGTSLGLMFGELIIEEITQEMVTIDNYVFFSTTKVILPDESKTIGFGILGNVFISSKLDELFKKAPMD